MDKLSHTMLRECVSNPVSGVILKTRVTAESLFIPLRTEMHLAS